MNQENKLYENEKIEVVEQGGQIRLFVKFGLNNDRRSYVAALESHGDFLTVFKPSFSQPGFRRGKKSSKAQTIEGFFRLADK